MSDGRSPRTLRRGTAEFALIVFGVFVALAAESWWSERQDRRFERELRDDMVAEFETNIRILEADLAANDSSQARLSFFDEITDAELQSMPDEDLTTRFGGFANWSGFDPEMGIVQALVESGNVGAVEDRELRLLLSRWAGLLEEKRRFNLQAVDFQSHDVVPVLARVTGDRVWTDVERREVQTLYQVLSTLQRTVIGNQQRLHSTALEIRSYLEDRR